MVSNSTCWTLIIVGIVLMVIGGVIAFGGFPSVPDAILLAAQIAFWIGVICFVLGVILLITNYVRAKTGS